MLISHYEITTCNPHSFRIPRNFCTLFPIWKNSIHKALPLPGSASVFKTNRDGGKHQDGKKLGHRVGTDLNIHSKAQVPCKRHGHWRPCHILLCCPGTKYVSCHIQNKCQTQSKLHTVPFPKLQLGKECHSMQYLSKDRAKQRTQITKWTCSWTTTQTRDTQTFPFQSWLQRVEQCHWFISSTDLFCARGLYEALCFPLPRYLWGNFRVFSCLESKSQLTACIIFLSSSVSTQNALIPQNCGLLWWLCSC